MATVLIAFWTINLGFDDLGTATCLYSTDLHTLCLYDLQFAKSQSVARIGLDAFNTFGVICANK